MVVDVLHSDKLIINLILIALTGGIENKSKYSPIEP